MKHCLMLVAILILSAATPGLARENNSGPGLPDPDQAQAPATRRARNRVGPRRKRFSRPHCPKVVVAVPQGDALTTPSGLIYIVTRRSQERHPLPGETVRVNYTGLLGSGVKFDSSLDRGQPFEFPLGMGRVIKGWDEGIAKLRVGEQATLIIPPQIAYGERGAGGVIPPNAKLIFLVELVGIKEAPKTTP